MVPILAGVGVFGTLFGALAAATGLGLLQAVGMSGLVFAGASQMLALQLWTWPPDVAALALAVFIINLRYVVLIASLRPWLARIGRLRAAVAVFFIADENWALAIAEIGRGGRDAGFLLGGGLGLFVVWLSATALGYRAGAIVDDPRRLGLDMVGTAVFVALAAGLFRSRNDLVPMLVAAVGAAGAMAVLPGLWPVIVGGLAGSLAGALVDVRR